MSFFLTTKNKINRSA